MIIQVQPIIAHGTSKGGMGLNYMGNSLTNRFLFSVIAARFYSGEKAHRLNKLVEHLARDLKDAYENPVWHDGKPYFFCCLGMKGDWPALTKIAFLERHHGREAYKSASKGICHLCMAGCPGFGFHRYDADAMRKAKVDATLPWDRPSALTRLLPQDPMYLPHFYKIDLFHTCHKGQVGDLVANAFAFRLKLNHFCSLQQCATEKGATYCMIFRVQNWSARSLQL